MFDSALARPPNLEACGGNSDTADFAATYGFGLAKNHPFVDGNKRAALLAVGLFLAMNGHRRQASQAGATLAVFSLAAGDIDEAAFARWIRANSVPRRGASP